MPDNHQSHHPQKQHRRSWYEALNARWLTSIAQIFGRLTVALWAAAVAGLAIMLLRGDGDEALVPTILTFCLLFSAFTFHVWVGALAILDKQRRNRDSRLRIVEL